MGHEQLQALEEADLEHLPEPVFVIAQARRVADALGIEISAQIEALRASEAFMAKAPNLKGDVFKTAAIKLREGAEPPSTNKPRGKAKEHLEASPGAQQRSETEPRSPWVKPLAWVLLLAGAAAAGTGLWQQRQLAQPAFAALAQRLERLTPSSPKPQAPASLPSKGPAPAAAPAPTVRPAELWIKASKPSWLDVRSTTAAGSLFRGTFVGERRFPIGSGLRLRAGRPDLVLVAQGSGPLKPLGTMSQIRWVSFKPADVVAKVAANRPKTTQQAASNKGTAKAPATQAQAPQMQAPGSQVTTLKPQLPQPQAAGQP